MLSTFRSRVLSSGEKEENNLGKLTQTVIDLLLASDALRLDNRM